MTLKLQVELELTGFSSFYRVYLYSRGWYYLKLLGNLFQRVHLLVSNIAKYLQPNLREQHGLLGNVEGPTHKCESASSGDNKIFPPMQNISNPYKMHAVIFQQLQKLPIEPFFASTVPDGTQDCESSPTYNLDQARFVS